MDMIKFAVRVARRWQHVPEAMTDDEALAKGIITPEMIEMIVAALVEMLTGCLANNKMQAWNRVRSYLDEKSALAKIGDSVGLLRRLDNWWTRMAMPREAGDVRQLRTALVSETAVLDQPAFDKIHTSAMFYAI